MTPPLLRSRQPAFTLVELLAVIAIIGILMALLIPAIIGVFENARRVQARHDIAQTIQAIKGFQTEYNHYPNIPSVTLTGNDLAIGTEKANEELFDILRAKETPVVENTRNQGYFEGRITRTTKGGFKDNGLDGGPLYDPWGVSATSTGFYRFIIDSDYNNLVDVSLIGGTGPSGDVLSISVAGMSDGKTIVDKKDDVQSW